MDPTTIDRLARLVGSGQSRRRVLKSLTGGVLGAVASAFGFDQAGAAARCRPQGVVCSKNADCCSSACLPKDRTGRRVCAECSTADDCPAGDACNTPVCQAGTCGTTAVVCDDNNTCTVDTCDPVLGCQYTPLETSENGSACTQDCECSSNNCFNAVCADFVSACDGNTCNPPANGCAGGTCCGDPAFFSCDGFCCGPPATSCIDGFCV
jgi:hypothetical protein